MSFIEDDNTTTWSWRHKISKAKLEPYEKLILYTLSLYVTEMGQAAFPSIERLESQTGLSRKTVLKYLASCAKKNWLYIVKTKGANGRQQVNKYYPSFPSVNGTLDGRTECISGQLPSVNGEYTECNSSTVYINRNIKDKYKENKNVLTVDNLKSRDKDDRVPLRYWGDSWVDFEQNCPQEFIDTCLGFHKGDKSNAEYALKCFYNFNVTNNSKFAEFKWLDILVSFLNKQKRK